MPNELRSARTVDKDHFPSSAFLLLFLFYFILDRNTGVDDYTYILNFSLFQTTLYTTEIRRSYKLLHVDFC